MRPRALGETALKQVEGLGFKADDVKQIVTTHLDPTTPAACPISPRPRSTSLGALDAAMEPRLRDRPRYLPVHWKHNPKWVRHDGEGDEWFGFGGVRILPDLGSEVLLIPLAGHSLGHSGVAIKTGEGWLLHCGDAYFHHDEIATPPSCPPGLRFFQNLNNADRHQRLSNQERLRELVTRHGEEVQLICSHDPHELDLAQAAAGAAAA